MNNHGSIGGMRTTTSDANGAINGLGLSDPVRNYAYEKGQQSIGAPVAERLQVENSLLNLLESVSYLEEMQAALIRRLEPVSLPHPPSEVKANGVGPMKAPLAASLDALTDRINSMHDKATLTIQMLQV